MYIYTVTVVPDGFPLRDVCCRGWYKDYKDAYEMVINNSGDLNEDGHYKYIVIERYEEGLFGMPSTEHWFEWDEKRVSGPGYIYLNSPPERFSTTKCWAMG